MNEKTLRILEFDKIVNKLVNLASSSMGKEMAASIQPVTEYDMVEGMLKETSDAVTFVARRGSPPLGGIHDIRSTVRRAEMGGMLNPGDLIRVADTLTAARNLKSYASESKEEETSNIAAELIINLETNRRLEDRIRFTILNEEEIADDASPALATIRRQIRQQQDSIKEKLNNILRSQKYQKVMQDAVVTMRGDRYVVPIKQEYRNELPGLVHDSSASGATLFVEPMAVVEANNQIRQLKGKEEAEIERILYELSAEVAAIRDALMSNVSLLAQLDFIFAKARLSLDYRCVSPKLNDQRRITIRKGRHPLLDPKVVVPIDFWIGDAFRSLIVTGPNTGGKTVTLKTVGLFTLMTQAGLHIPANEGTEMSVFRKVFADIGDEQSIEQSLSTFSSHMKNIVNIMKDADDMSLVMFDELGAGTDPTEGAALAMSILENLYQIGAVTVATTHYSELKVYALSTQGVENASCEFDVETLKPTYRLLIGIPGKSNAFAISSRLGLSEDIIHRAKEFLSQEDIEFEDVLLSIEKDRVAMEQEKMTASTYRQEIEKLKRDLEDQKNKLENQKEKVMREAKEEARKIMLQAKRESEDLVEELRRIMREQEEADRTRAAEEIRHKLRNKVNRLEESLAESVMPRQGVAKPPKNLKPGDSVLIINLNQRGTVVTPPDKNGEAMVQAGIMKINVHVTNLRLVDEQKEEIQKINTGRKGIMKAQTISTEVDVRGSSLDQAIEAVDKYLDDAVLAGLKEVSIIHGKGTGVLRSGIHQFLRSHGYVKEFRLGTYGEGDTGVTIATLK